MQNANLGKKSVYIKDYLYIVLIKNNNHEKHQLICFILNFLFSLGKLFKKVLNNINNSFKYISSEYNNFKLKVKIKSFIKDKMMVWLYFIN